jgi:predicted amidohydrolase YtcJ
MGKVLILKNAIVLTMDTNLTKYDRGAVAVDGSMIKAVGNQDDLR